MAITASEARQNLFSLIEQVNQDRTPEITSKHGVAVLLSIDDYRSLEESAHLADLGAAREAIPGREARLLGDEGVGTVVAANRADPSRLRPRDRSTAPRG